MKRQKVVFISHCNVISEYQYKLNYMSDYVDVYLVTPAKYYENKRLVKAQTLKNNKFQHFKLKTLFGKQGFQHFHFYIGLFTLLKKIRPDVIHLEEEARSIVSFQAIYLIKKINRKAKIYFYSALSLNKNWNLDLGFFNFRKYFFSNIQNYVFKNATGAIALSNIARDVLLFQGYKKKIFIIPQNSGQEIHKKIKKK